MPWRVKHQIATACVILVNTVSYYTNIQDEGNWQHRITQNKQGGGECCLTGTQGSTIKKRQYKMKAALVNEI